MLMPHPIEPILLSDLLAQGFSKGWQSVIEIVAEDLEGFGLFASCLYGLLTWSPVHSPYKVDVFPALIVYVADRLSQSWRKPEFVTTRKLRKALH